VPRSITTIPFSRIRRELVRWAWRGRVALGKVNVIEGDGSCGKSTLLAWIAAQVSRGELDGDLRGEPSTAIIFSAEDGAGDTIRPRLEVHGAELGRVRAIDEDATDSIALPDDLDALRRLIIRTRAKLVVFDPIASFLGHKVSITSDASIRRALGPLKHIAADTGAAMVLLRHLNAQRNAPAYRRGLGGAALANIARSVLVMALHPDDGGDPNGRRVIAYVKGNLDGRDTTSIETALDDTGRLVIGPEIAITADELLRDRFGGDARRPTLPAAVAWLREFLDGREVPTLEVEDAAAERDISQRTLERARAETGVLHRRVAISNANGSTTRQTVLRLPGLEIVEEPDAPLPPPIPIPALSTSSTPSPPGTMPSPLLVDDTSIRFSFIELDDRPSAPGGAGAGEVGGVSNSPPINGNQAVLPTPPSPSE
jgi:hypothetical protein